MNNKSKAGKTYQIERKPGSTPEINYKYETHNDRLLNEVFDTPEKLVKRAVLIGKIRKESERDLIDYIDLVMDGNNFYHMTDYRVDENGAVSIPLTLKSLDGFLKQWEHEKQGEPSAPPAPDQLPEELDTPGAREIFEKAIDAGFIEKSETGYKWKDKKNLLAYFADRMNEKLHLGKGMYDKKQKRAWKPFETLFGITGLAGAEKDYQRSGTTPEKSKEIDLLFDE